MIDEAQRLLALQRYQVLDTPQDGVFDRLTRLAAKIFNMPIALITLVDTDRVWFKSESGLPGVRQVGKEPGLCATAILSDELYLVENARLDPRTLAHPLVAGEFGLQFYTAAPLRTHDGHNLGTFCLLDKRPRYLNSGQEEILQDLAAVVMDELEIRLAARREVQAMAARMEERERKIG
ncbi:MAG: GAF domain-containing protein [Minicystis sp.]